MEEPSSSATGNGSTGSGCELGGGGRKTVQGLEARGWGARHRWDHRLCPGQSCILSLSLQLGSQCVKAGEGQTRGQNSPCVAEAVGTAKQKSQWKKPNREGRLYSRLLQ